MNAQLLGDLSHALTGRGGRVPQKSVPAGLGEAVSIGFCWRVSVLKPPLPQPLRPYRMT
jgi:hypothetical protein